MTVYAKDRHKRAAKMPGYALTCRAAPEMWHGTAAVRGARLTTAELASIACAALVCLAPANRELTFNAAHWGGNSIIPDDIPEKAASEYRADCDRKDLGNRPKHEDKRMTPDGGLQSDPARIELVKGHSAEARNRDHRARRPPKTETAGWRRHRADDPPGRQRAGCAGL